MGGVVDGNEIRVRKLPGQADLAPKAVAGARRVGQCGGHDFQGHAPVKQLVPRQEDRSHAAPADALDDRVLAKRVRHVAGRAGSVELRIDRAEFGEQGRLGVGGRGRSGTPRVPGCRLAQSGFELIAPVVDHLHHGHGKFVEVRGAHPASPLSQSRAISASFRSTVRRVQPSCFAISAGRASFNRARTIVRRSGSPLASSRLSM